MHLLFASETCRLIIHVNQNEDVFHSRSPELYMQDGKAVHFKGV